MNIFSTIILLQIFLFSLGLLLTIGYFSLRKLVLPCFGCSKGSWWYRCAPNTGYGTDTCTFYKKTYGTFASIINYFGSFLKNIDKLYESISITVNKIKVDIPNMATNILDKELSSQNTDGKIKSPPPSYTNFSCEVLPGLNPCSIIRDAINGIIRGFHYAGNGLIKGIIISIRQSIKGFIELLKQIINGILKLFMLIINNITKPFEELFKLIFALTKEISDFMDSIFNIGIPNIIIFNIISFLNMIVPGPIIGFISYGVMILFLCVMLPLVAFSYVVFTISYEIAMIPIRVIWWFITNLFSGLFTGFFSLFN